MRKTAAALLMLAPLGAVAGCNSAPRPTPDISPTAVAAPVDERITLPTTMGLAFKHPRPTNRIEHQVLYTVQQSVRAQLHAEYGAGSKDPLLGVYWSGSALSTVRHEVTGWSARHQQPVGVLVVSNTVYTPPDATGKATVSFCASWRNVMRGDAKTHVVGPAVQKAGTPGTYTALTLTRAASHWQVSNVTEAAHSPKCAASK
ncbi:hypothetical protein KGA66_14775 [Actinocrinis puniceicyclus]|uniref:Lipoprotein n=1 Tax=Actinocrinis puniceicyclus TaxID=977794 RepID=A0A8J7WQV2_9ACTN|nr:hypothetical protein [Actinocrinis puniceicyclus]MBS2964322.1 hypothetical protein [Actinocrinis puniceicyclus]